MAKAWGDLAKGQVDCYLHDFLQLFFCDLDPTHIPLVENLYGRHWPVRLFVYCNKTIQSSSRGQLNFSLNFSDISFMIRILRFPLFVLCLAGFSVAAESTPCETSHKNALLKCKAYEHHISADQIRAIGQKTRVRVAEKETDKLFGMGRACAEAQKACNNACSATNKKNAKLDITDLIELQSDCSEGQIAEHRSKLAEKYLNMKAVLEESRTPASQ